jgi:microcompartment protein CcmL/EutN
MKKALGLIETKGLVAAIAAADRALKSARIILEGKEITEPGYVTVRFTGELTEIQIAVASGSKAARETGELISCLVIADPDSQLSILLMDKKVNQNRDFIGSFPPAPLEIYNDNADLVSVETEKALPVMKKIAEKAGSRKSHNSFKSSEPINKKINLTDPLLVESSKDTLQTTDPNAFSITSPEEVFNSDEVKKKLPEKKRYSEHPKKNEVHDTIARLRMEALGKKPESSEPLIVKDTAGQDLSELNVHQLRKLARNTPDFPIFGRKISKANRDELLRLFNGIKN